MKNWQAHVPAASFFMTLLLGACSTTTTQPPPNASTTSNTQGGMAITSEMIGRSRGTMSLPTRATDATYGYSEANPVKIGGGLGQGADRTYQFLNALRGPNGEAVRYDRSGSSFAGEVLLDVFTVTYPGLDQPRTLYFNWYEEGQAMVPVGLTAGN
ncbi:MAG TPA: hypothetical protein VEK57_24125 [Thermoanaerobaculia bacterium]|nr:hypothetical protein [Thermoanaerobaculia bacterium]